MIEIEIKFSIFFDQLISIVYTLRQLHHYAPAYASGKVFFTSEEQNRSRKTRSSEVA